MPQATLWKSKRERGPAATYLFAVLLLLVLAGREAGGAGCFSRGGGAACGVPLAADEPFVCGAGAACGAPASVLSAWSTSIFKQ